MLEGMKLCDLKCGDRVVLVARDKIRDKLYRLSDSNPLAGTKHECVGTITEVYHHTAEVDWDNGTCNTYVNYDLAIIYSESGFVVPIW